MFAGLIRGWSRSAARDLQSGLLKIEGRRQVTLPPSFTALSSFLALGLPCWRVERWKLARQLCIEHAREAADAELKLAKLK